MTIHQVDPEKYELQTHDDVNQRDDNKEVNDFQMCSFIQNAQPLAAAFISVRCPSVQISWAPYFTHLVNYNVAQIPLLP
jgi:hypothetical protein